MRLVSILAFTVLVGCADKGDEGFFILNNTAAPIGGACTFTGDAGQPFVAAGAISHLATQGYFMSPLLESRITAVTGTEAQRTIHLEGANVTAAVANGGMSQSYTVLFSGSLAPNGGTTNVGFELLPVGTILALGKAGANTEVITTVTPYGTLGGGRIDGEPFQYPVTILSDTGGIVFGADVMCTEFATGAHTNDVNSCNPFQDGAVDCCRSSATGNPLVCPGQLEM